LFNLKHKREEENTTLLTRKLNNNLINKTLKLK